MPFYSVLYFSLFDFCFNLSFLSQGSKPAAPINIFYSDDNRSSAIITFRMTSNPLMDCMYIYHCEPHLNVPLSDFPVKNNDKHRSRDLLV